MPRDDSVTYKGGKKGWVCGCPRQTLFTAHPLPYTPAHLHRQPDTATDDENIVSKVFVLSKNISCKGYQKKKI